MKDIVHGTISQKPFVSFPSAKFCQRLLNTRRVENDKASIKGDTWTGCPGAFQSMATGRGDTQRSENFTGTPTSVPGTSEVVEAPAFDELPEVSGLLRTVSASADSANVSNAHSGFGAEEFDEEGYPRHPPPLWEESDEDHLTESAPSIASVASKK